MKKYKCMIVDDEHLARELLETHLSELSDFKLVASCESAIDASRVLQENTIDLMFLDIQMPVLNGLEFYNNLLLKPKVIFTTAFREYAIEGFEVNAVDYLLKPIVFSRFFNAIERFKALQNNGGANQSQLLKTEHPKSVFVQKNRKQVKINLDAILYVQSLKDYVEIHLKNQTHVIKHSITALANQLGDGFIRVHRSYLVNRKYISAYTKQDIEIGDIEIPIGESYKESLFMTLTHK